MHRIGGKIGTSLKAIVRVKQLVIFSKRKSVQIYFMRSIWIWQTSKEDGRKCFKYVLGVFLSHMVASKSWLTPPTWVIGIYDMLILKSHIPVYEHTVYICIPSGS